MFYAAYFGVLGVVLPYLGPYLHDRGIGAVGIGLVTAAFSLAKLAYTPFVGVLVDRGRWFRGILSLHVALAVGCALLLPRLGVDLSVALAFVAIGLGYGTVLPLVEASILERVAPRGYGVLRLWGSVGFVLAAIIAARIISARGVQAFPFLLAAFLAMLGLSCLPFEHLARPARDLSRRQLSPALWMLLVVLTLHQMTHGPYYAFFSIHLEANGVSSSVVGVMWSLGVVAELAAFLLGPRLQSEFGLRRLLGVALAVTPLRWLLLALPVNLSTVVLAQAGHAVSFALVHLAGIQLVQRVAPPGSVRYAQALYSGLAFGLGIVAGSALAGPIYATVSGAGAFAVAAVSSVLLAVAWLPLSKRLRISRA